MKEIATIGLDLARNVFQVHGVDAKGIVVRRQVRRAQVLLFFSRLPPCLVGMEACAGAHYWSRELAKLGHVMTGQLKADAEKDETACRLQAVPGIGPITASVLAATLPDVSGFRSARD